MLDDLTKEIKAQLYERVKSPLFGAFALSWVAWNYRALLAVISDMPFKDRMVYLDGLYPSLEDQFLHCLWWPLLTATLFLLAYPWPARGMYWYWAWQQKELKKVQQGIEDETPITQEEANALRKEGLAQAKEYKTQLKEFAASNKELEERIKLLQEDSLRLERERDMALEAAKKAQEELSQHLAEVLHDPAQLNSNLALERAKEMYRDSPELFIEAMRNGPKSVNWKTSNQRSVKKTSSPVMGQVPFPVEKKTGDQG